jgi:positive regulator of sigma E activity
MDEGKLMALSLLQYGLPALAILVVTAVSRTLAAKVGAGEGWIITGALCALVGALTIVRLVAARLPFPALLLLHNALDRPSGSATT